MKAKVWRHLAAVRDHALPRTRRWRLHRARGDWAEPRHSGFNSMASRANSAPCFARVAVNVSSTNRKRSAVTRRTREGKGCERRIDCRARASPSLVVSLICRFASAAHGHRLRETCATVWRIRSAGCSERCVKDSYGARTGPICSIGKRRCGLPCDDVVWRL